MENTMQIIPLDFTFQALFRWDKSRKGEVHQDRGKNLAFNESDLHLLIISQTTHAHHRLAGLGKDLICAQKENLCSVFM